MEADAVKIVTNYEPMDHPSSRWLAYDEDTYDAEWIEGSWSSSSIVGYGPTEAEAIADLEDRERDADVERAFDHDLIVAAAVAMAFEL